MWKEPQLESRSWVRCQSRAFFASAAVFSFLPVARGWFPGSGSSPASDFPMPGAPFTWTESWASNPEIGFGDASI